MSVLLQPGSSLSFNRPFTQNVKRSLAITNPNEQPVAFKVKTTAPKLYCVRPNSGTVQPGETVEVQVMLQAMKDEPPLTLKCKDKFLIQSTSITPGKEASNEIWTVLPGEDPDKIKSQKIKVVYLPPDGALEEEDEPGNMTSVLTAAESRYDTVRGMSSVNGHAAEPVHQSAQPAREGSHTPPAASFAAAREEHHEPEPAPPAPPVERESSAAIVNVNVHQPAPPQPQLRPPTPPAPAPVPPVQLPAPSLAPPIDPNPELVSKYQDAQAEIQRLRALLASVPDPSSIASASTVSGTSPTELRRRHRGQTSDDGTTMVSPSEAGTTYSYSEEISSPEGVPLQVVCIIALMVFITTYLFF